MTRIASRVTGSVARAVVAALLAPLALATPSRAASADLAPAPTAGTRPAQVLLAQATAPQAPAPQAPAAKASRAPAARPSKVDRAEARIKDLHAKLNIAPAQEDLWKNVAQVMRDNATTMETLTKGRAEKAQTMTAVDDLKSYGEITEAHADGLKKFVPVFEALYASMSDAQKKNADTIFRHTSRRARTKTPSKSKSN
jgi:protein CpxP